MDHSHAAEHKFVEQYLLRELSPELRDEFEEHFFDCGICAAELRATDAFLEAARLELRDSVGTVGLEHRAPGLVVMPKREGGGWKAASWGLAIAASLLLAFLGYQNIVTLPRLRGEVATLNAPEVLPAVSLVGGGSRGGDLPAATVAQGHSILLQFDIPDGSREDRFGSYRCSLFSPQHDVVWTVEIPAAQAKDTVSIRVPLGSKVGGTYSLEVRGLLTRESAAAVGIELANYRFVVNADAVGAGH